MPHPVYLVRHGQSEWNVLKLTQGQTMHPRLTAQGRAEARAAAELIAQDMRSRGGSVARIITSDLVRAVQTAEILCDRLGGVLRCDERLREHHLGDLEGKGYQETWAAADEVEWSDPSHRIGGGESVTQVRDRMVAVLTAARHAGDTVLVSHGDSIRAVVADFKGIPAHEAEWVEVPNGAVARVDNDIIWLGQ